MTTETKQKNTSLLRKATNLTGMSTARKEVAIVIAMQRDVQYAWVIIEGFLGAVAVVNILDIDRIIG